jgi:hypothetical protein
MLCMHSGLSHAVLSTVCGGCCVFWCVLLCDNSVDDQEAGLEQMLVVPALCIVARWLLETPKYAGCL